MSNQSGIAAHIPDQANGPVEARDMETVQRDPRGIALDPRRARMVREVEDFGFDWRVAFEAGRLVAAMALGALLTFWLVGHRPLNADELAYRVGAGTRATPVARVPAASPEERGEPAFLAPLGLSTTATLDTPQRDAHSDGGGH